MEYAYGLVGVFFFFFFYHFDTLLKITLILKSRC